MEGVFKAYRRLPAGPAYLKGQAFDSSDLVIPEGFAGPHLPLGRVAVRVNRATISARPWSGFLVRVLRNFHQVGRMQGMAMIVEVHFIDH